MEHSLDMEALAGAGFIFVLFCFLLVFYLAGLALVIVISHSLYLPYQVPFALSQICLQTCPRHHSSKAAPHLTTPARHAQMPVLHIRAPATFALGLTDSHAKSHFIL